MKWTLLFLVCIAGICLSAGAQTYSGTTTADTFVAAMAPNSNYGAAGAMQVAGASGTASGISDAFLEFSLGSGITNVQSIILQLNASTAASNGIFNNPMGGQFEIYWMQNSSWVEGNGKPNMADSTPGALTYSNMGSYTNPEDDLGTFTYSGATSGDQSYPLPLDSGLLAAIASGSNISLELAPVSSTISYVFHSKEFGSTADAPTLIVAAVPEPGDIALVTGGLIATTGALRRKRRDP